MISSIITEFAMGRGQALWREQTDPEVVDAYKTIAGALDRDPGARRAYIENMQGEQRAAGTLDLPDPEIDPEGYAALAGEWVHRVQMLSFAEAAAEASYEYTRQTLLRAMDIIETDPDAMARSFRCQLAAREEAHRNPQICMVSMKEPPEDAHGWVPSPIAEA